MKLEVFWRTALMADFLAVFQFGNETLGVIEINAQANIVGEQNAASSFLDLEVMRLGRGVGIVAIVGFSMLIHSFKSRFVSLTGNSLTSLREQSQVSLNSICLQREVAPRLTVRRPGAMPSSCAKRRNTAAFAAPL